MADMAGYAELTNLLQEKADLCNAIILDFLLNEPVATVAPVRRAQPQPVS